MRDRAGWEAWIGMLQSRHPPATFELLQVKDWAAASALARGGGGGGGALWLPALSMSCLPSRASTAMLSPEPGKFTELNGGVLIAGG